MFLYLAIPFCLFTLSHVEIQHHEKDTRDLGLITKVGWRWTKDKLDKSDTMVTGFDHISHKK